MVNKKKNILVVCFDDLFAYHHYKHAYGPELQTPNLDRIAAQSAHFQSAYCQATLCGPSRASFMSGKTPHQSAVLDNTNDLFDHFSPEDLWPYRLKENGFFCSSGGKMHHGYGPLPAKQHEVLYSDQRKRFGHDFDLPKGVETRKYHGRRGGLATVNEKDDDVFYDARSTKSVIDFLENYDGDAPFYREVGFFSPHGPWFTPSRFKELYDPEAFSQPKAWENWTEDSDYLNTIFPPTPDLVKKNTTWWQYHIRNYFSAVSHGDFRLGRVWDALKSSRFANNTLVIILADHGFQLGTRNRFYKSPVWEQSAGVPLIIHDPENPKPSIVEDPVALIDLGPTVLDYAGLAPLRGTVGKSLRPQVEGHADPDRAIATFRRDNFSVRIGQFRFVRFVDGSTQLFNLENDIWNINDLGSDHPSYDEAYHKAIETANAYGMSFID